MEHACYSHAMASAIRGQTPGKSEFRMRNDLDKPVCSGTFGVPSIDSLERVCNGCGAVIDAEDPELARGRGRHAFMLSVPIGPDHRSRARDRSVERTRAVGLTTFHVVNLSIWERLRVLVWGWVRLDVHVSGVVPTAAPIQEAHASVPKWSGQPSEPVLISTEVPE